MEEPITLEVPTEVMRQARDIASRSNRAIEDVLIEWLDRAAYEVDPNSLSDEAVLALADAQMDEDEQEELNELLELNREGELTSADRMRLDELMQVYRRGNLRKAKALVVAVRRGLRPPLTDWE